MIFERLFGALDKIKSIPSVIEESWGFFRAEGQFTQELGTKITELGNILEELKFTQSLTIHIDGKIIELEDCDRYTVFTTWSININKLIFVNKKFADYYLQFFYSKDEFLKWSNELNPFESKNPINQKNPLKIIVNGLKDSFGGNQIIVCSNEIEDFDSFNHLLPVEKQITQVVHFITQEALIIEPTNYLITFGSKDNLLARPFLKICAITLASSLLSEYYNNDKIILRGIKRIQLKLTSDEPDISMKFISTLREVVSWVYEDKVETRIQLLIDRITLDLDYDKPFLDELVRIIDSAFQQAKERYNFVIIERKDNYLKELGNVLKDVKSQSDLYSTKIRSLLSNLMRDVLAGFILVGFSFFTKITEMNALIDHERLIQFVFKGFAIYFVLSSIIQSAIDIIDLSVSRKEIIYWRLIMREYIPEKDFKSHIKDSLRGRRNSMYVMYPLVVLIYWFIALACWHFPQIWQSLIIK